MRKDSGFTIVELLVVIAVMGIITAIALPNFMVWLPNYRLKGAIGTLRGDLYNAKILATKRGVQYKVVFSANGYQIQRGTSSSGTFTLDATEITRDFSDYPGVTVDTTATSDPVFSPRGTSSAVTITLKNSQNKTQSISVTISGRIKVN